VRLRRKSRKEIISIGESKKKIAQGIIIDIYTSKEFIASLVNFSFHIFSLSNPYAPQIKGEKVGLKCGTNYGELVAPKKKTCIQQQQQQNY
jgi:hypothetical protein